MGRPRKFSREGVLQKALPVFWKYGFARTTLPELEQATGVNKSGLYAEFESKEAFFLACLRHYLDTRNGGTSLMVTLACIGILMNVSAHTDFASTRAPASGAFPERVPA